MFAHPIINTKATQGEWYAKKFLKLVEKWTHWKPSSSLLQ